MTQIEKAQAWFRTNGYTAELTFDMDLCVNVWNDSLEESIEVHVSDYEIEYRAELWDSQQETNQTQLPL
jgi:hypothetical protein